MRMRVFMILLTAVTIFAAGASAQVGRLGVGVHGTWVKSTVDDQERDWVWGFHARARVFRNFALEGSLDLRTNTIDDTTIKLYPMQVTGLFYLLPASRAGLYGLFGVGWTRISVDGSFFGEDVENTEFSYHWGFGLELSLGGSSTIFADVRYLDLDLDISKLVSADFETKGWQANFGYTIYF